MSKTFTVNLTEDAQKQLDKLDGSTRKRILVWLNKNLEGTSNPRAFGKGLSENLSGLWRYRVGKYRLLADILDDEIVIDIIKIGHRSIVYDSDVRY